VPAATWAWIGLALLGLLSPALLTGIGTRPAIDWRPSLALAEPWRWWSAAWVHLSGPHLLVNAVGAAVVALAGAIAHLPWRAAGAWALAWPLTHLLLLVRPSIVSYGGLSGVLHAGVAVVAVWLARSQHARSRPIGWALLAGLAVKVMFEAPWRELLPYSPTLGIATVPFAHAAGLVAGALSAWLLSRVS
jgi:rhomboid family GlyGly-CTERM serine protease